MDCILGKFTHDILCTVAGTRQRVIIFEYRNYCILGPQHGRETKPTLLFWENYVKGEASWFYSFFRCWTRSWFAH